MGKDKKRKMSYRCLACVLACALACGFSACKKETPEKPADEVQATPVTEAVTEGFADANAVLVKQRAEEYAKTTAVTVGNTKISMQKAMFLIYSMEVQGNSFAAFYESQYGMDYWNMAYDESGRTTADIFKEETIATLIKYAVLQDCAVKYGMVLTEEEQAENENFVEEIKLLMAAEEAERGGFTTENLREICGWMMLGEKYYGKMTENLGVSKEEVRESIAKEDYKEYETEYLYLPTTYYDEEYTICNESEEVIKARKEQMQACYEQVLAGTSFEELASSDETLVHNTRTFLAEGEGAEEAYKTEAAKLKVGEVCAPIQTEYGVYIVRMLDDACTKSYEAAVEAEYELQRSKAFQAAYEVLLAEYEVTVNEAAWEDITLGATVSILE